MTPAPVSAQPSQVDGVMSPGSPAPDRVGQVDGEDEGHHDGVDGSGPAVVENPRQNL